MIIVVVVRWLIFSCEYLHALLNLKGYLVHLEKRYYKVNCYVLGLFLSLYDDIWYVTYLIDSRCLFDLKCLSQMDGGGINRCSNRHWAEINFMLHKTIFWKISLILSKDLWEMNLFQNSTIFLHLKPERCQLLLSWTNPIQVSSLTF